MYRGGLAKFLEKFEIYFPGNNQEYAHSERERNRIFEAGESR